ncbi:ParB N-terminal domain-containing protein [Bacillaceae bacterium C204]|uniref:ParB N-terminal domain-containing protein n=1 Tax=Neobacillus sp. 204 TaxID=3383351 RepID=UPI00397AEADB
MQIVKMKMADLKPADYNPRKISNAELEKLKRNIEVFGYVDPMIWNKRTQHLVGGHQRYKALSDLGFEEVDVVVLDMDLTKEKALNIALNKVTGEFDLEMLKDVLLEIDVGNVDIELSGFSLDEIEGMMTRTYQEFDNDEVDLDDFEDDKFNCRCPECDFHFNSK